LKLASGVWLILSLAGADIAQAQETCRAQPDAPRLDHVVIATPQLDSAASAFMRLGFRIKQGRLHANRLLNRHIKFRDGTEIELMTVAGQPGDRMARDYAAFLAEGEGGAYVALAGVSIDRLMSAAQRVNLDARRSSSGTWQFLSFPEDSPAANVFFGFGIPGVQDHDSIFDHGPAVGGLHEVWLEGSASLAGLLRATGAQPCGPVRAPDGSSGERWALAKGSLVLVPAPSNRRPRVLGVVLSSPSTAASSVVQPLRSFWLQYPLRRQ
jgi:hypothetical protein